METNIVSINQEMRESYLAYAMSVIIGRAIPDVRDGLKPVHRRILYAMHDLGNVHNRAYKKSARIVGDVIGKYHPHGDTAVYDATVRMAQPFSLRYPLVDGQGNFGSIDGDPPAAMRYTEIRMTRIAEDMLLDIDKDTVNFSPNYDESLEEPVVLPARIPALLVNGSSGIAVGMATNIPSHNMGELIDAIIKVIDKPSIGLEEIMDIIPGPDFPTGGIIFAGKEIKKAYAAGKGIITIRGRVRVEEEKKRERLVITEIPYGVNKARLIERVAMLVQDKKAEGISNIRDESDKDGMRIVLELKRDAQPKIVENQLYKMTNLQTSFGINMLAIHNGSPKLMGLIELISAFISFREEVVTRRSIFELKKARARMHILEGLKKALGLIDEVIAVIKGSATPPAAREALVSRFSFSEIQAQAILDMRLQRLTGLEREKIEDEYTALQKDIARLERILADRPVLLDVIKKELLEIKDKYNDKRRTLITRSAIEEFEDEDLIPDEKMVVTISRKGYIKRTEIGNYRVQRRGGLGIKGGSTREGDFLEHIFIASTHASLLYVTNTGRVYRTKVYEVPEGSRTHRGIPISNLRPMQPLERICAILIVPDLDLDIKVVMATKNGVIKRVGLKTFSNVLKSGIIACALDQGDEVIAARLITDGSNIIVATKFGKAIVFEGKAVRVMGRQARGVRAIRLDQEDEVVAMDVISDTDSYVINLTEYGYGKRTRVKKFHVQGRGGKGVYTVRITKKTGNLVGLRIVNRANDIMIISSSGQIIRMSVSQIRITGRSAQGVRAIRLRKDEKIIDFTKYVSEEPIEQEG